MEENLEKHIKAIPKDLYDSVMELAEITFLAGKDNFPQKLANKIIKASNDEVLHELYKRDIIILYTNHSVSFSSIKLQIYLAMQKMVKKDNKTIYDIENEKAEEWYENEQFLNEKFETMHMIAAFNQKKFNKEYLLDNLQKFIKEIDAKNDITITISMLKYILEEIEFTQDIYDGIYVIKDNDIHEVLIYLGINLISIINSIDFSNYEMIIRNNYFKEVNYKDSETGEKKKYEEYVLDMKNISDDSYFIEILKENNIVEDFYNIFIKIKNLVKDMESNLDKDYFEELPLPRQIA